MSAGPTRLWCELAWLGGDAVEEGVLVEVDGERIASVRAAVADPPGDAERLGGVTIPAFANAHSHAFQRALRGRTHGRGGSFWTWREQMYELAARLDPDRCLAIARAAFGEMALAGIAVVGEFHYLHHGPDGTPYTDPNAMGAAIAEAARQAGIRVTLLDACYLHGGIGTAPEGVQRRFADVDAAAWTERVEALDAGPGVRVGAAVHSVRAVDPESVAAVAAWASERSLPLHAHVSEQAGENEDCRAAFGASPAGVLERAGALSERFTAVHLTHPEPGDAGRLGRAGATCCICPTTERDLGDGIAAAGRIRDEGAAIALGSDSHAVVDLFEEARAVELDERLEGGRRGVHATADLLRAATEGGYASVGWPEGGRIEPGALADLVTVGLDSVRLADVSPADAIESLVFAASAADVHRLMVGGRVVVRAGRHLDLDVAAELREAAASLR